MADLLTPVGKAWSTDMGFESASLGVPALGGFGYIEASGMPQRLRDARIPSIYEGAPTLAILVGDDEEPILIDRSALQIAIDQGWATVNDSNVPVPSFRPNSDGELDAIDLDIDLGPMFE